MSEEYRDPELESVRAEWTAPPPCAEFHSKVLCAFDREFAGVPWRRWPVVAAAAAAAGLFVALVIATHLSGPAKSRRYEPVRQPRFIIIVSQGEHP